MDVGGTTSAVLCRVKSPAGMAAASRAYARRQAAMPRPRGFDPGGSNGCLMRTGPVCLPFLGGRSPESRKRIAAVAREVSDLTHADPYCGDACVIWCLAVARCGPELGRSSALSRCAGAGVRAGGAPARFWAR